MHAINVTLVDSPEIKPVNLKLLVCQTLMIQPGERLRGSGKQAYDSNGNLNRPVNT